MFLPFGSHVCSAERVRSCGSSYHLAGRCARRRRRTDVLTTWQAYAQRVRSSWGSTYLFPGVPAALSECVGACVVISAISQECAQSRARSEHARSNACSHHMWAVLSGRVFLPFERQRARLRETERERERERDTERETRKDREREREKREERERERARKREVRIRAVGLEPPIFCGTGPTL